MGVQAKKYEANQIESKQLLSAIANLLACPTCRDHVEIRENHILCKACRATYEILDPLIKVEEKTLIWFERWESGARAVIKMYHHRGIFSSWRGKWFKCRAQREFELLDRLVANGIPCSKPLFWSKGYSDEFGLYEILATYEIPDAKPLKKYLTTAECRMKVSHLAPLFQDIRAMHKCGIRHGRITFRNIMVREMNQDVFAYYIIDMSHAQLFPYDISGTRMAWYDLKDISAKTAKRYGIYGLKPLLSRYGLTSNSARKMISQIEGGRSTSDKRKILQIECDFKAFCSAMGLPLRGKLHKLVER